MATRFSLFVQSPFEDTRSRPEIVCVSSPAGSVGAGPSDGRMYVVEPLGKTRPYGLNRGPLGTPYLYLPAWSGRVSAPALPDDEGNFDHYEPHQPGFMAAHVFGCVRFTLDVWERYLGQPVQWHFRDAYDRLEISLLPQWDNAQYGYGFLEVGSQQDESGHLLPFGLDFDIIAHEVGHAVIYSVLGVPEPDSEYPEYLGFQESFADCVSLIAAMHFPSVVDTVLSETRGNLYLANRLTRFSESAPHRQLRSANNTRTMAEFVHGWKNEHELSQPLTGAVFDVLADIFHESLVERRLISPEVEALADIAEVDERAMGPLQDAFDAAYARDAGGFCEALTDARDIAGTLLAETLWHLEADYLDYGAVARVMLAVDAAETGGRFGQIIDQNFRRRQIGELHAGPRIVKRKPGGRLSRNLIPLDGARLPRMSYRERMLLARTG
jgi:hypothetical protein